LYDICFILVSLSCVQLNNLTKMKNLISLTIAIIFFSQIATAQNYTAKKYVNVELFTNTWCGLCAFYDPAATATYQANKKDIHLTTIYPNVPYPQCPFNQANLLDNNTRKDYYGVTATPRTFTQGTQLNSGSNLLTQSFIDTQIGQNSPLRIEVIETGTSTNKSVFVYVKSFDTPPTGDLRLFIAAVVEEVNFDAQNGLTEHKNVLWQYLSNENGDDFNSTAVGDPAVGSFYTYNTNNLTHPSYQADEVYVIAFIQDIASKRVINSGSSKDIMIDAVVNNATCGSSNGTINLSVRGGSGFYTAQWSNGASTQDLTGLAAGDYTVTVTDNAGAEVYSTVTVNCIQSCIPSLNFSGTQFIPEIYVAGDTITSNATINANITYNAGNRITLTDGFSSPIPFNFQAKIEGCN